MRETKFRGKRIDTGEWVYGDLKHYSQGQVSIYLPDSFNATLARSVGFDVHPESVGQYIGVKANGEELYSGDIAQLDFDQNSTVHVIQYQSHFGDYPAYDFFPSLEVDSNGISHVMCEIGWSIEIIGTKFDNPELLEVKQ